MASLRGRDKGERVEAPAEHAPQPALRLLCIPLQYAVAGVPTCRAGTPFIFNFNFTLLMVIHV